MFLDASVQPPVLTVTPSRKPGALLLLCTPAPAAHPTIYVSFVLFAMADAVVTSNEDDLLAVARGDMSIMAAFMRQKIRVTGKKELLRRIAPALHLSTASIRRRIPVASDPLPAAPDRTATVFVCCFALNFCCCSDGGEWRGRVRPVGSRPYAFQVSQLQGTLYFSSPPPPLPPLWGSVLRVVHPGSRARVPRV
jgi:hypothetical protein